MRTPFNSRWTKHLRTEEERTNAKATILASRTALDRLKQLIAEEVEDLNNQEASSQDYDSPSWSHKQAHRNGQKAMAKSIIDLLTFEKH